MPFEIVLNSGLLLWSQLEGEGLDLEGLGTKICVSTVPEFSVSNASDQGSAFRSQRCLPFVVSILESINSFREEARSHSLRLHLEIVLDGVDFASA